MRRIIIILFILANLIFAQSEISEMPEWIRETFLPPQVPVQSRAEWEECDGVMMSWVVDGYAESVIQNLCEIIDAMKKETTVYLMCPDAKDTEYTLREKGISLANIFFIQVDSTHTIWARDFGPQTIYTKDKQKRLLVDWVYDKRHHADDMLSLFLGHVLDVPVYKTMMHPYDLMFSGANLIVDGHGLAIINPYYLKIQESKPPEEFDIIFEKFLGIDRIYEFDIEYLHLDFYAKLLDERTLLVEEPNEWAIIKKRKIQKQVNRIRSSLKTSFGHPFRICTIPMPEIIDLQDDDYMEEFYAFSYINSVIVNDVVFVPTFNCKTDEKAIAIYKELMPGYRIIGINCLEIGKRRGNLHCVVRDIGVQDPIYIKHDILTDQHFQNQTASVLAIVEHQLAIKRVNFHWRFSGEAAFHSIPMDNISKNVYQFNFTLPRHECKVEYYLSAESKMGKVTSKPFPAPRGWYSFKVSEDAVISENNDLPEWIKEYQTALQPISELKWHKTPVALADKIHLAQIVLYDQQTAKDVLFLLDAGKDFNSLASAYSIDRFSAAKKGDVGFFKRGDMPEDLEYILFQLAPGEHTKVPIKTAAGYCIFKRLM